MEDVDGVIERPSGQRLFPHTPQVEKKRHCGARHINAAASDIRPLTPTIKANSPVSAIRLTTEGTADGHCSVDG